MNRRNAILANSAGINLVIAFLAACGFSDAGDREKNESRRIIGELKSQKNTPDGHNTFIEVLAPGEEKARRYYVLWDPKINAPIASVLAAVRAARVGDKVEFDWVSTGHGPAIKSFQVFRKGTRGESKKVHELLNERLATVRELAKVTRAAYMHGTATFAELRQANVLLLKAELELCESDKERVAVHEKAVALAKDNEKIVAQLYKSGQAAQASVLAARADRLDAEIAWERAKARVAAQSR
jgi:hypothetical protein